LTNGSNFTLILDTLHQLELPSPPYFYLKKDSGITDGSDGSDGAFGGDGGDSETVETVKMDILTFS
jgi:hypothetical protein